MTGRHFLLPSPPARAFLSAHAVLILRLHGPDHRRGHASIQRAQGCPWPPATSTRIGSRRPRRSTGPQDLLVKTPKRSHETSLRSLPAAVAASRDSADTPGKPVHQATPRPRAARVSVMVKIGSKAPANVRTFFPRPPQAAPLFAVSLLPRLRNAPRCQGMERAPAGR
jgi:hypothetical protein